MDANNHRNNFDLIRLLAAFQVAFSPIFGWLQIPLPHAVSMLLVSFPGVPVFFVVSGFLITRSYVSRQRGLLNYFGSRALRIYPALWLQYLLVFLVMACTGGFALATLLEPQFWTWLLSAMFIGSNFWANVVTNYNPFLWTGLYKSYPSDVLWTITVELGFYLLVPLVFSKTMARLKLTPWLILLSFAASLTYALHVGPMMREQPSSSLTGMIHSSPLPYFWLFLAGATAANYWQWLQVFFVGRAIWWVLAWAAVNGFLYVNVGHTMLNYRDPDLFIALRALLLAGMVLALAHSWTRLSSWMRGHDISYGLYLFHMPLPLALYSAGMTGQAWLGWASLLLALVLAGASWILVESPCLELRKYLGQTQSGGLRSRLPAPDWRRLRPQLWGLAVLVAISLTAFAVSRSTLLDMRGPFALKHFFAEGSGLVAQPYQTPGLVLHRGVLQVSSDKSPAGLSLVVEASQDAPRKLELEGRQRGEQLVSGRLTVDSQPSSYFRMPDGPLSITVPPGSRVELLIYADLPYAYEIEKAELEVCLECVADAPLAAQSAQDAASGATAPSATPKQNGLAVAAHFFGENSGVVVQPYQTPQLELRRGNLHIRGETPPAGLGLVVEASPQGMRKLELVGRQLGPQMVSGRLTINNEAPTYFRMPDGPYSVNVEAGARVELLIYADTQFAYQIEKASLTACPQCSNAAQAAAEAQPQEAVVLDPAVVAQAKAVALAQQFFGEGNGLVVQLYQTPELELRRGKLQISDDTGPAGLALVVEASQEQMRKLELTGHRRGSQIVSGRLTIDNGAPSYFHMPDGPYSVNVEAGARVELLIYADKPFAYEIEQASLTGCPQCVSDAQMMSRIKREIPALEQSAGERQLPEGLAAAEMLMQWVSPKLVIEGDQNLQLRIDSTPLAQILSESFEGKQNGVSCGGFAVFLARLLSTFGYEAFAMDFGVEGTLTHVTTVVAIGPPEDKRFYVFDPTFNARLVKASDGTPLDLAQALALPAKAARLYSAEGATRDLLLPEDSSVAAAEKAGGQCEVRAGRQLCRNVDQVGLMLDPLRRKLKRQGLDGPDIWLGLLRKGVFSITGAEPATREALVKVLNANSVAFMGSI